MHLLDSKMRNEHERHNELNKWLHSKENIVIFTTRSCRPVLGHGIFDVPAFDIAPVYCSSCLLVVWILVESRSTERGFRFDNSNPLPIWMSDFQTWETQRWGCTLWRQYTKKPKVELAAEHSTKSCWKGNEWSFTIVHKDYKQTFWRGIEKHGIYCFLQVSNYKENKPIGIADFTVRNYFFILFFPFALYLVEFSNRTSLES